MSTRFVCFFCREPLRKKDGDYSTQTLIEGAASGLERVYHNRCLPSAAPPDSPFQAALQKAKQAIADARRLGETEYVAFCEVVELALREQRDG